MSLLFLWATLLLGSAWIIAGLLRHASSAVRLCIWQYALMGLLVLPFLFAVLPGIPLGLALTGTESIPASDDAVSATNAAQDAVIASLVLICPLAAPDHRQLQHDD